MSKLAANSTILIGLVTAVIAFLVAFGVDVSQDQQEAILGLVAAGILVLGIYFHPAIPVGETGGAEPPAP